MVIEFPLKQSQSFEAVLNNFLNQILAAQFWAKFWTKWAKIDNIYWR